MVSVRPDGRSAWPLLGHANTWRAQAQQPSNTLIVRFTSTKILQGELFTYLFSGRCKSLTDQNNLAAVAGGAPRIEREVAKYVAVALSGFTA